MRLPLDVGRYELRTFSDDSPDPIVLELDHEDGRALGLAVADVLTALDAPGITVEPVRLVIAGREVTIEGTAERGMKITVAR